MKIFSHYSIGYGFGQVDDLLTRADALDLPYVGLTDIHGVGGCPELLSGIENINASRIKSGKQPIKPYVGATINIKFGDSYELLTLICKNTKAYKNLLKIFVLIEQDKGLEYFQLSKIKHLLSNFIISPVEESKLVGELSNLPNCPILSLPTVCYANQEDAILHRVCVADHNKTTFEDINKLLENKPTLKAFWNFTFELKQFNFPKEFSEIEAISLKNKPILPKFDDDVNSDELLRNLCREGWSKRQINKLTEKDPSLKQVYIDRIQNELKVIAEAKLSDYFLIIHDIIKYCRNNKSKVGLRGSAAGCLLSYLSGITDIDPVWPDKVLSYHEARSLSFARFYNHHRNTEDHIALPDVDCDLCPSFKGHVKQYLKNKYGSARFADYILTHGRYDGKGAFKTICRVMGTISPEEANNITQYMLDYAKVQDEVEDRREDDPKYNTLKYNIENIPEIADFYKEYTKEFDLAVKLSGTCYSRSKHAAGVVISARALEEDFPVILDPSGDKILGLEMEWAEYVGAVKYDLLCVAAYEKINQILRMTEVGASEPVVGEIEDE